MSRRTGPAGAAPGPALPAEAEAALDRLALLVETQAARFAAQASSMVSAGRERAVLRSFGVSGIDREGRPLAAEVVDRYVARRPDRLADGIGLPFALALEEYDSSPQDLALDIAAGRIDLGAEAALLADPGIRTRAESRLAGLVTTAGDRIDANRIARAELRRLLSEPSRPWLGVDLREPEAARAIAEADQYVRQGADLVRVEVPAGRELASGLGALGRPVAGWLPSGGRSSAAADAAEPAPAGSQRGLAKLRDGLDRLAVSHGTYLRLAVAPAALAGPEGALVAAVERADLVDLDPMADIVDLGVDPVRAMADLAAVASMCGRADLPLLIGPGPLVVGPELAAGTPSDPAVRSGRAFGLQSLAVRVLGRLGLDSELILVGGLPPWICGEPDGAARAAADLAVRSRALAATGLALVDPGDPDTPRWAAIVGALGPARRTGLLRVRNGEGFATLAAQLRAGADVAAELDGRADRGPLAGVAADHAVGMVAAAVELLGWLAEDGWPRVLGGDPSGGAAWLGSEALAPRTVTSDATAALFG